MPHHGRLRQDFALALAVIDTIPSQLAVVDSDGVIIAANEAWLRFALENDGHALANPVGLNYLAACEAGPAGRGEEKNEFAQGLRAVLSGQKALVEIEYPCHTARAKRWFLASIRPVSWTDERTNTSQTGAVICHFDITERKTREGRFRTLSMTDDLTQLPNRRSFMTEAKSVLQQARLSDSPCALLYVDLDDFKAINDRFGHVSGDAALKHLAAIGRQCFRQSDLFARLGGEEFVCLLPNTQLATACKIAERFRRTLALEPVRSEMHVFTVTASIGVVAAADGDTHVNALLHEADTALYRAKSAGKNCVCIPHGKWAGAETVAGL